MAAALASTTMHGCSLLFVRQQAIGRGSIYSSTILGIYACMDTNMVRCGPTNYLQQWGGNKVMWSSQLACIDHMHRSTCVLTCISSHQSHPPLHMPLLHSEFQTSTIPSQLSDRSISYFSVQSIGISRVPKHQTDRLIIGLNSQIKH